MNFRADLLRILQHDGSQCERTFYIKAIHFLLKWMIWERGEGSGPCWPYFARAGARNDRKDRSVIVKHPGEPVRHLHPGGWRMGIVVVVVVAWRGDDHRLTKKLRYRKTEKKRLLALYPHSRVFWSLLV